MSRKRHIVQIEAEGRDKGKHFLVTEMSAWDAEKWATKALLALGRSGVDIPDDAIDAGMAGVMAAGLSGFARLPYDDAAPLLDEMMACVAFVPDPSRLDSVTGRPIARALLKGEDGDIEEVATLVRLRSEVAELHLGFSLAAVLSTLAAHWQTSRQPDTPTSRRRAARPSSRGAQRSTKSKQSTA
jgi:hypothetical protein